MQTNTTLTVISPYGNKPIRFCGYLADGSNITVTEAPWSEWCKAGDSFKHVITDDKHSVDFITGYLFKQDGIAQQNEGRDNFFNGVKVLSRRADNVEAAYALLLDYDDDREKLKQMGMTRGLSPQECHEMLKGQDISHWIYTSHSHGITEKNGITWEGGANKFRCIIPLKQPVPVKDITDRTHQLRELFRVDDTASFSASQGFYVPSRPTEPYAEPQQIWHNAKSFDLLSIEVPSVFTARSNIEFSAQAQDWFSKKRQQIVDETVLAQGARNAGLKKLAITLRKYHANQLEIQQALELAVAGFSGRNRQQHQNKPKSLAAWAVKNITDLYPEPEDRFQLEFTTLSEAQKKIKNALNTDENILLNVTPGAGKSRGAAEWAVGQDKCVAFFGASNKFQYEIQSVVSGQIKAKRTSKWNKTGEEIITVFGRDKLCDFPDIIKRLQHQEAVSGERGLVKEYCLERCLYAGGDGCKYFAQHQSLARMKVYNHAYLFTGKGLWDNFKPEVVVIDEDLFSAAHDVVSYNYEKAVGIRDQALANAKCYKLKYTGAVGSMLMELVQADIKTAADLSEWVETNKQLVLDAHAEQKQQAKDADIGIPSVHRKIVTRLAEVAGGLSTWEIYTHKGVVYFSYLKQQKLPDGCRVIVLDATADRDITSRIIGRNLTEHRVDVDKADSVKVTQVRNTGASKHKVKTDDRYAKARMEYLKSRRACGASIITNKAESVAHGFGDLWFGKCRGFNDYENVKELHIAGGYNIRPEGVENAARAIYWDASELSFEQGKVKTTTRGTTVTEYRYLDDVVAKVERFLAVAELEQAIHRARLIRRNGASPLHVFIHSNKPVNVTVDETVTWQDLYGCKEADQQASNKRRSNDAEAEFVQLVRGAVECDGQLVWRRTDVLALGVSERQWRKYKDAYALRQYGFNVELVRYLASNRQWKTQVVVKAL